MGLLDEVAPGQSQMMADLAAGLDTLDLNQTVTFTQYNRVVLPADGFVFWVKADILNYGAQPNSFGANTTTPGAGTTVAAPAATFQAQGSLHHTTVNRQDSDESFSVNRMIFTSKDEVNDLTDIAPTTMWLGETSGQRYAFSSRTMWYRQAGLYHYAGDAVYPALASQIIDNPAQLNLASAVVSNSLPVWLGFNSTWPVYPSYLVPDNLAPPYISVNIDEGDTHPLQSWPLYDGNGSRWQLTKDIVRITTYGMRNNDIMDWLDGVQQFTLDNPQTMGIMNSPIPRDAKRGQTEISAIAQKKVITFEVNYYQQRIRDYARKLITQAFLEDFIISDTV